MNDFCVTLVPPAVRYLCLINCNITLFFSYIRTRKGKEKAVEISGPYLRSSGDLEAVKACYNIHSLVEINKQPLQHLRDTS